MGILRQAAEFVAPRVTKSINDTNNAFSEVRDLRQAETDAINAYNANPTRENLNAALAAGKQTNRSTMRAAGQALSTAGGAARRTAADIMGLPFRTNRAIADATVSGIKNIGSKVWNGISNPDNWNAVGRATQAEINKNRGGVGPREGTRTAIKFDPSAYDDSFYGGELTPAVATAYRNAAPRGPQLPVIEGPSDQDIKDWQNQMFFGDSLSQSAPQSPIAGTQFAINMNPSGLAGGPADGFMSNRTVRNLRRTGDLSRSAAQQRLQSNRAIIRDARQKRDAVSWNPDNQGIVDNYQDIIDKYRRG